MLYSLFARVAQAMSAQGHPGSDGTLQQCETVCTRRFVCVDVPFSLFSLSFSHFGIVSVFLEFGRQGIC